MISAGAESARERRQEKFFAAGVSEFGDCLASSGPWQKIKKHRLLTCAAPQNQCVTEPRPVRERFGLAPNLLVMAIVRFSWECKKTLYPIRWKRTHDEGTEE
jgi:hypothetical protein